jgi:Xaa-Pro aminopeptidase
MAALFPQDEYAERLVRLRAVMAERGIDAVIADECEMLHYFTGFTISENLYRCVVIPKAGTPTMVVRKLDEQPFVDTAWFDKRRAFADIEDSVAVTAEVLKTEGAHAVGLDMNSYCMTAKRFQRLQAQLPGARFVDLSDVMRALRLNKSPREIEVLKKAAHVADEAMRRCIAATVPGASSRTGPITVGRGWNFLHGKPTTEPLRPGDILHVELVPKVQGYCARLMRPAVMGEPSAELSDAAARLIEIQDRQIAAMVPGAEARAVDAILREGAVKAGLRPDYVNNTGYTLGYYFEQAPRTSDFTRLFTAEADWTLEPGMVFHMYTSAAAGVAFSETVWVSADGPVRLTQLERKLFRCGEAG